MPFFNVFLRTLGFLIGITVFIILLNLLFYIFPEEKENFDFVEGNKESNNIIAILDLNGPIINNFNQSLVGDLFEYITPNRVKNYLSNLKKIQPNILIIKINSPGGTVTATTSLEKIINDFKKENKIEVYFYSNEILASGGYWVATSGDKIYANYGSIIGSIGVSGPSWYYFDKPISVSRGIIGQKIETKNGIKVYDQNAGTSKDLYNPFRKPKDEELSHLNEIVMEIYDDFLIKVSNARKIEINILKNEIGALIYSATQAKKNFLIDDILDFDLLIDRIITDKNFIDYKIVKMNVSESFISKYLVNYFNVKNSKICNKLNSNFVSIFPYFLNNCWSFNIIYILNFHN